MIIGPGKPKRVSENPWECRIGMGQECPRKENGPRKHVSNGMGQEDPNEYKSNDNTGSL